MSYGTRPTGGFPSSSGASSLRQSLHPGSATQQSSVLSARIASKRAELDDLKRLRDVSKALAKQMETLEEKLASLRDGTEAVACVMANWNNVLRAISMASTKVAQMVARDTAGSEEKIALPAPLVRIPVEPEQERKPS